MASQTHTAGVESLKLRTYSHSVPLLDEQEQVIAATRAARAEFRPQTAPQPGKLQLSQGLSPIQRSRQGATGTGTSWMATREAIDADWYEEQLKRRLASRLEEDDSMYDRLRQERTHDF